MCGAARRAASPEEDVFYNRIKRQSDSYYNGHDVFVVTSSKEFKLQVFIDKKTYAIIHLEYENTIPEDLGKKSGLERKFESLKRVVDFKFYEGKFFLNYLTVDYRVNWYDPDTHELKFETELQQILLINHVVPNVTNNISFPGKMRRYGLQYQDQPYNKKFWEARIN